MAVSKAKVLEAFSDAQKILCCHFENEVDKRLSEYRPGQTIDISVPKGLHDVTLISLIRDYRAMGWGVKADNEQRDGESLLHFS